MFKGESVIIRNVRERDLEKYYSLSTNFEDPGEFMPVSLVSETTFRSEFSQNGFWSEHCGRLLIVDKSGDIVGEIGCFKGTHYLDGREVYYRIFSGYRGKGYASEALGLFIDFFFESSAMNRLQAVTVEDNNVSEHMLKKVGFIFEGTMRQSRYFNGHIVNLNMFSLLRDDWRV